MSWHRSVITECSCFYCVCILPGYDAFKQRNFSVAIASLQLYGLVHLKISICFSHYGTITDDYLHEKDRSMLIKLNMSASAHFMLF